MLLNIKYFNSLCCFDINYFYDNWNVVNIMIYYFVENMKVEFWELKINRNVKNKKYLMWFYFKYKCNYYNYCLVFLVLFVLYLMY